jgi:hypothetical protein
MFAFTLLTCTLALVCLFLNAAQRPLNTLKQTLKDLVPPYFSPILGAPVHKGDKDDHLKLYM